MGKKKEKGGGRKKNSWSQIALLAAGVLVVAAATLYLNSWEPEQGRSFSVQGGETKQVLNPSQFRDLRVSLAYQAAAKYPEAMDEVYCYCYCDRAPFRHKSLLSCFTDNHGAG